MYSDCFLLTYKETLNSTYLLYTATLIILMVYVATH